MNTINILRILREYRFYSSLIISLSIIAVKVAISGRFVFNIHYVLLCSIFMHYSIFRWMQILKTFEHSIIFESTVLLRSVWFVLVD